MEIRASALKLIEMASASDAKLISFNGGGAAVLESLKISRSHASKDWQASECPVYDPAKPMRLCGVPFTHDPTLPLSWISVLVDGRYIAGAYVDISSGCSDGIAPVLPPTPEAVAIPVPPKPVSRRRTTIQ